ncbi:MAG: UDPGP type 1 family protein [Pirellulales bacterium]
MKARERMLAKLEPIGQQHLLQFWDELDGSQRTRLCDDIAAVDFDLIARLAGGQSHGEDWAELAARATPPRALRLADVNPVIDRVEARKRGAAALAAGQVGVILVAGGQGTRLGFPHPKGMFPVGPVSSATLFQILIESIVATRRKYGAAVPLYLMTSPATDAETREYLAAVDRFGLTESELHVFCQGTMPAVDAATGRVLLSDRDQLFRAPDGHGGLIEALERARLIDDMHARGLKHIYYMQVDNPLVRVCDPTFIGSHLLAESELSTQVLAKQSPLDRVGNVVTVDGHMRIIEYSDLPDKAAERRTADGSLELWAGNCAVHVLDVAFLDRVVTKRDAVLPYHVAHKRVPYIDESGELVEPAEPNAYKFERFVFDLLPEAERPLAVEIDVAEEFAPVKNPPGSDMYTPEASQQQMIALHRDWLRSVGVDVPDHLPVEISPLAALEALDLAGRDFSGLDLSGPVYVKK